MYLTHVFTYLNGIAWNHREFTGTTTATYSYNEKELWDDLCREAMEKERKRGGKGKRPSSIGQMPSGHIPFGIGVEH